jgi:hypothetical protein
LCAAPGSVDKDPENDDSGANSDEDEEHNDLFPDDSVPSSHRRRRKHFKLSTALEAHAQRATQCKHCQMYYLEGHNTSMSCIYHPGNYLLLCPNTCSAPGLTPMCAAHRVR